MPDLRTQSAPGSLLSNAGKDLSGFLRFVGLGGALVVAMLISYWASSRATDALFGSASLSETQTISAKAVQAVFLSSLMTLAEIGFGCLKKGTAFLLAAWASTFAWAFVFLRLELSPSKAPTVVVLQIAAFLVASRINRRFQPWKWLWPVEEPADHG